ncbi:MAG: aminoacyl-histidine dipeptidase [Bacteroidota bacterium]|nr:aminoacyl-histidine dipeptidase [Bacteroidota bacterium]
MTDIRNLKPEALWKHFYALTQIPRPSKKEGAASDFAKKFGEGLGLETHVDKVGNVIIRKPATPGMEDRKGVVLQGHLDMVPQKNSDVEHDFEKDPIQAYVDGDWVTAKGTTLGADNGMGVAAAMAVLESNELKHPMIEALFTIDEETGMTGANNLEGGLLIGDILMNMDSEDEGELYVGCAGGVETNVSIDYDMQNVPEGAKAFKVHMKGLKGGHSGLDIHRGRGNANKLMFRLFKEAVDSTGLKVAEVSGGDLRNAIPRECVAVVTVDGDKAEEFLALTKRFLAAIQEEYKEAEDNLGLDVEGTGIPDGVLKDDDLKNLVEAIFDTPHGVIKMSESVEGLIETSSNLAIVELKAGKLVIKCLTRSAVDEEKMKSAEGIKKLFDKIGAEVTFTGEYPGWKPNMDSEIMKTMGKVYEDLYGKTPEIKAIHAGLECGILGNVYTNWDMISFGPTIRYPHSPDEKVNIETVEKFWNWLIHSLENIPKK